MSARTARIVLVLSAFVVGLALTFGLVKLLVDHSGLSFAGQPAVASVGGPFKLIDGEGKTVTDQDLKGKPFLVFFGFTNCPEVCPTTLFELSEVFKRLGKDADKTAGLFITVDPERDTPAVMRDYISNFDPHLHGLTGDAAAIDKVIKEYRVYARKVPLDGGGYTMDHTALVYLMDKQGRFVAPFSLKRSADAAAADLRKYL
jgi:protein SCO1/2